MGYGDNVGVQGKISTASTTKSEASFFEQFRESTYENQKRITNLLADIDQSISKLTGKTSSLPQDVKQQERVRELCFVDELQEMHHTYESFRCQLQEMSNILNLTV